MCMPLTIPQQNIFDRDTRFACVSAGRRFGKTYLSMYEIARVARHPGKRIFYVAPSFRQAKQIIWEDIKHQMFRRNWAKRANESDLTLQLVNGSTISLRSADNPDSMRGVSLDFAVLDECAYMSQDTWTSVLRPTLSDRQGGALFISTPAGYNWFYDMWQHAHTAPDWSAYQYTTLSGGNVPESEVEAARADLDLRTFQQEYEAQFNNSANNIFYAFDTDSIETYDGPVGQLHIGMDFNVSKMCATVGVRVGDGLHIIDEIVLTNSNTSEMAQEILNRYGSHQCVVYPDPAGSARKTSAVGKTDHMLLAQAGFKVKAPRSHDSVKDGINSVNRLLQDASGQRRLFVDPKCKETITCLSKHQYKSNSNVPDKDSGYDHMTDAVRYLVHYLFPIRNPANNADRVRAFGHF